MKEYVRLLFEKGKLPLLTQSAVTSVTLQQGTLKDENILPTLHCFSPDYFLREGGDSEQGLS